MSRNRRFSRLLLLAALLCASLASAAAPTMVAAASHIYRVDSARDDSGGTQAACEDINATNKSCTLRQALAFAASDDGPSEIRFIIPAQTTDPDWGYNATTKTWTISPASALPTISANDTTLLGKGFFAPSIVLDGNLVPGTSSIGIKITSSNNEIRKLAVVNFKDTSGTNGVGILISGTSAKNNVVAETYIGVAPSGDVARPNSSAGIKIDAGASNNLIGGA